MPRVCRALEFEVGLPIRHRGLVRVAVGWIGVESSWIVGCLVHVV